MATYNLNEVLKQREAEKKGTAQQGGEVALDDVSRVKVLSPGRQVFKRFIRNRLAVFGSTLLIIMFVFSFLGPIVYPYGQKTIFYKYDKQNVNYALAKANTAFNGYDLDSSVTVERNIVNAINSSIKSMIAADLDTSVLVGNDSGYQIRKTADNVYILSQVDLTKVCTIGKSEIKVGTYASVGKKFTAEGAEIPGLADAAAANVKGSSGSFTLGDVEYTWQKGTAPKTSDIFMKNEGIAYAGEALDAGFEDALNKAAETGASFTYKDVDYTLNRVAGAYDVYTAGSPKDAKIYTSYTLDTFVTGTKVADDFRANALLVADKGGSFTAGGEKYTLKPAEGALIINDASGAEFAEFNSFSVRRYSGEDTMDYDLKKAISEKIEEMLASGQKNGTLVHNLPEQNEDGSYMKDENGNLIYDETEMKISQRLEGEYVINCDQINFVIDRFAAPSGAHILGTDGDGFDVMARIMYGGRISLMVGFVVVFIETFLGVLMGGIAGYFGGWVDNLIMRLVDIFYCLPSMPIMIILGAMMDALRMDTYLRLIIMMAALGIMGWAGVARLVRGQILALREQEFMVATEATGIRIKDRIFKHLVPNVMPQLIVTATMGLGGVILTESTLSFLGLGVKHPLATWGTIINSVSSASAMAHYAFIWIPVGMLICLTVIAFNFVGDGLRDAYDPKAKR